VAALVGDEALAGIARACWRARPPTEGDITRFATALPAFIEADPQLAELPWLADVARLELALCAAESAADAQEALHTLAQLGERGPAALRLRLAPGSALLRSRFPVVSIWLAHHGGSLDLQGAAAENAWVWREGWKARVQAADAPTADFVDACLKGAPLDQALAAAGPGFDFEHWLLVALRRRQLLGATAS
jgi:hypothetical protein